MDGDANEFTGYDAGYRLGTFDKCNGKPAIDMAIYPATPFNIGFGEGYVDAYVTNERMI
jgi:hypothetical protein